MTPGLTTALLLAACLGFSFMLSGLEAGLFALSRLRVRQQMRAGRASARLLHGLLENPENFLWTILVGNTLMNFVFLSWVIVALHGSFGDRWLAFALLVAGLVFLFYALCDLLPKMLFRTFPNRLCLLAATPFRFVHLALRPLVAVVEWVSRTLLRWTGGKVFTGHLFGNREELKHAMQESAQAFSSEERGMISRVLELQTLAVRRVATPIAQAVTVTTATPVRELLVLARERGFTRLPVWETREGVQRVAGLVSVETLLFQENLNVEQPVGAFMKPALYLAEDDRLETALRRMQRAGQRLAVVLGRDQRETGILTLEDILKVIFGEVKL